MKNIKKINDVVYQLDTLSLLTKNQKKIIFIFIMINILDFFDLFLIGFVIAIIIKSSDWMLNNFQIGIIISSSGIGTVIGSIFLSYFADKYGRKKIIFFCIILIILFNFLSVITPLNNWFFLFITRIIVSVGISGLNIVSIPYIQEFMPTNKRGLLTGLSLSFVPLGLLLGSITTLYLSNIAGWRGILIIGCMPMIILLFLINHIPESPRYLTSKKLFKQARLAYAWIMNIPINNVNKLTYNNNSCNKKISYFETIKNSKLSIIIISVGSFCFIFVNFTIQTWGQTILQESFYLKLENVANLFIIFSLGDFLGRLFASFLSDYIGRRITVFIFGILGSLGCIICALSFIHSSFLNFNILEFKKYFFCIGLLLIMSFGDGAFGIINIFGSEMFNNKVRSTCLGLGYGIGSIAKIIGPIFMSYFKNNFVIPFFVFFILLIIGSLLYLLSRETKNIQLEKI